MKKLPHEIVQRTCGRGTTGNDLINTLGGTTTTNWDHNFVDATQGGNDTINGGGDVDFIALGNGNNVVNLGGGKDYVESLVDSAINIDGNNLISGGGGSGIIHVGDGNDILYRDAANDECIARYWQYGRRVA